MCGFVIAFMQKKTRSLFIQAGIAVLLFGYFPNKMNSSPNYRRTWKLVHVVIINYAMQFFLVARLRNFAVMIETAAV